MDSDDLLARHAMLAEEALADAGRMRHPPMRYKLTRSNRFYACFVGLKGIDYCYTLIPDLNGDFWTFNYVPKNGTTVMHYALAAKSMATAKARALRRCKTAEKKAKRKKN